MLGAGLAFGGLFVFAVLAVLGGPMLVRAVIGSVSVLYMYTF